MKPTASPLTLSTSTDTSLFQRIAELLDAARGRVVRTVNQETVTTYWLIGREIVQALQERRISR